MGNGNKKTPWGTEVTSQPWIQEEEEEKEGPLMLQGRGVADEIEEDEEWAEGELEGNEEWTDEEWDELDTPIMLQGTETFTFPQTQTEQEYEALIAPVTNENKVKDHLSKSPDISFNEFNNVAEEDLVGILEEKYPWLDFDQPFIFDNKLGGGANRDVIQITNPETGKTKDFDLGTDFNRSKWGEEKTPTSKSAYNDMLGWITEERKDGGSDAVRTLGEDYVTGMGSLPVTPEITKLALKRVQEDETGLVTMESAINDIVDTEFGQMNTAWRTGLYNKEAYEIQKLDSKVEDLVIENGFDVELTTQDINDPALFYEKRKTLEKLGVPKEVFSTPFDREILELSVTADGPSDQWYLEKLQATQTTYQKEQLNAYLDGSTEFTGGEENSLGPRIKRAYGNARVKLEENFEYDLAQDLAKDQVTLDNPQVIERSAILQEDGMDKETADATALTEVINSAADEIINTKTNKISKDLFHSEKAGWRMDESEWAQLDKEKKAMLAETNPAKRKELQDAYLQKVRNLVNDNKINLLRSGDGSFIDPKLEEQNSEAKRKQGKLGAQLEEYMWLADDELTKELFKENAELKSLAKEIVQEGYSQTMIEGTISQQIGEGLSYLVDVAGKGVVMGKGNAYKDFQKLNDWINGSGKMPLDLTTLPEASGSSDLIKRYNDLLEKRSTLLLAKELNVNPLTYSKANTGMGRFFNAFGAAVVPALGGRFSGEQQAKEHTVDILGDAFNIEMDAKQKNAATRLDSYERVGDMSAGLVVMAGEMALTYPLLGGAANISKGIFAGAEWLLGKTALSQGTKLALSKYAAGVGTEYVGLLGSNVMEDKLFNREGIKNPLLFAAGAGVARMSFAKMGTMYNDAIINTAKKAGNENLKRSLLWISEQPGVTTTGGAIKRTAQFGTRNLIVKPTVFAGEALTGAIGIKAGEGVGGLYDVIKGEKSMHHLFEEITDPESLFETAAALMFMKGSRPDQYVGKAVDAFYAEADMLANNNPAWNRLRKSMGMKRLLGEKAKSAYQDPNYIVELQDAYAKKINEISKGEGVYEGLDQAGRDKAYDLLNFNFNRLKLKPALDQIAADYKSQIGEFSDLELASLNISQGGFTAKNLLKVAAAAKTSPNGSSPIVQLMANGYTEGVAKDIVNFGETLYQDGMELFGGNMGSKNFETYSNEAIKQNSIKNQLQEVETQYKKKKVSKTNYEEQVKELNKQLNVSEQNGKKALELEKVERAAEEKVDIQKLKDEGLNVIEGNDASIKKYMDDANFNFSKTQYGYQGIDPSTGKGVALVNTEATARDMRRATETHEVWHFPFERKMGDKAIAGRAEELMKDNPKLTETEAVEKADGEAREYIKNFNEGLKERGILNTVANEMAQRGGFLEAVWNKVNKGEKVPMAEMKEFLNEFIQLDKAGSFDMMKSDAQIKSSKAQTKKNLSETEYTESLNDPKAFVDFVLNGKYKSKNINEFLKKEQDAYTKEFGKEEGVKQGSERQVKELEKMDNEALVEMADLLEPGSREKGYAIEALINKNPIIWEKLGYNKAKGDVLPKDIRNSVIDEFLGTYGGRGILKTYNPTDFGKFSTYLGKVIFSRKQQIYQRAGLDAKKFETDRLDAEHTREIAAEGTPETDMIESEGGVKSEVKKNRIDPRRVLDSKAKEKYNKTIKAKLREDIVKTNEKTGEKTIDLEKLDKLDYANNKILSPKHAAEFFGISEATLAGKNPLDSKNTTKGEMKIKEGRRTEEGSEAYNLNKKLYEISEEYSKLLNTTQLQPKDIIQGDIRELTAKYKKTGSEKDRKALQKRKKMMRAQDGQRAGDQSKQGTSLNLDKSIVKALYEKTDIRSMGKGSQPYLQTAKYLNSKNFRNKAGIVHPKDFKGKNEAKSKKELDAIRNQSTLNTALARNYIRMVEGKIQREALEEIKLETNNKDTKKSIDKAIREIYKGSSKFSASERGTQKAKMDKSMGSYDFYNPEQVRKAKKVILKKYGPIFGPALTIRMLADLKPSGNRGIKVFSTQIGLDPIGLKSVNQKRPLTEAEKQLEQDYIGENETLLANDLMLNIKELEAGIEAAGLKNNTAAKAMMEAFGKGKQDLSRLAENLSKSKDSKGNVVDNLKNRKKATKLLIDAFKKAYDVDPKAAEVLREFIYNNKASSMLGKNVALMRGKHKNATNKNKYEEHTYPFSSWAIRTMDAITSKVPGVLEGWKEWSAENYYQTAFDKTTKAPFTNVKGQHGHYQGAVDQTFKRVDGKGDFKSQSQEHPILEKALNEAFKTGDFSKVPPSEIRFFNEYVQLNPNKLYLDGKTYAEKYDVEVPESLENNPNIIEAQSRLIFEQMTTPLTAKQAKKIIKLETRKEIVAEQTKAGKFDLKELKKPDVLNLSERMSNKDLVNKAGTIDKALDLARKMKKPIKKARVFDFDDTVAKTKSSVIYTERNTTGKPSSNLKAIVMAGGPGSGKSTVIKKLGLQEQGYKIVNQDISLEWAKELVGLDAKEAKYDAVQRSVRGELGALSRKIADKKLGQYTTEGKGVILDGTGASIKATEAKVKALKDKGYEVSMVYVETSRETALNRNRNRKERSLKDKIVETTWDSVNANKQAYKDKFGESFFEIDANKSTEKFPSEIINKVNSKLNETIRGKITPAEFAKKGEAMEAKGAKWDFSEFNKVVDGKKGPLFDVMKKMKEAAGDRDMFILTARAPEAAEAIQVFLKEMGIDLPLENIKGLADSSPYAKSDWILEKAAEGYNDFYFADDHTANVKAVQDALDALPVKGKTQQAKFNPSMRTKRDLKWKKTRHEAKTKFEIEGKTYTIDLAKHVDGKDYTLSFGLEHLDKKGVLKKDHFITGTGNAAEILSIISNGVVDFVKKNKVNSVHFTSLEGSRTRLYTTLTKLWANELGWKHEIESDGKQAASFVISKTKTPFKTRLQPTGKFNKGPVEKVLDVVDVKGKVQQTRMNASERLDKEFNKILEEKSGIEWYKEFSETKGKLVGAKKGRGKFFLPPGAEDFTGLIYPTLGKGKKGDAQLKWYNDNLINPYNRATRNLAADKIQLMTDFKGLKKQLNVPKDLRKSTDVGYTKEQMARIYLWDKMGEKIPGTSAKDLKKVLEVVEKDVVLKTFADRILEITKGDGYSKPSKEWLSGTITTDLIDLLSKTKRAKYLEEWSENMDVVFSKKNLNKLEAIYGPKYRAALENSIQRMKTGRNRTSTGNKASDRLLDYINGAQGTIMFLNMRSAVLQSISAANFINLGFNNPIKAGRAFVNQKQYWKDFMSIMNSDYLVGRRQGLKLNISESEISEAAAGSTNKAKAVINYILEKGYAPTKFMDSFAIASGGATWYRNRIKDLTKKEGLSEKEAQKKAFEEFMEISEKSQQSSDPSKISKQQSSDMGRVFLQFVNTPMQYTRMQKRAVQDLANKRGDWKSNVSKVLYYGVMQNVFFNAMQQGLFALGFGDDEINEKEEKKIIDTTNGMVDSILRGTGFAGMTLSVLKNTVIDLYRRSGKKLPNYRDAWVKLLGFSPAVKSKVSKLRSAAWPFDTKKGREEIKEKGFSLDNPAYESLAKVISAATNIPLDRLYSKYNNLSAMMREDTEVWKDIALFLGWPEYQLEEGGTKRDDLGENIKNLKKNEQVNVLKKLGMEDSEIKKLKKEEDRVEKILEYNDKSKNKVSKILNEKQDIEEDIDKLNQIEKKKREEGKGKHRSEYKHGRIPKAIRTDQENSLYDLSKEEQEDSLIQLDPEWYTKDVLRQYNEGDRVEAIITYNK